MRAAVLLSLTAGALAMPGKGQFPSWFDLPELQVPKILPPKAIRDLWPQFNTSQWEAYHCLTFDKVIKDIAPPCSDYCENYAIGPAGLPGGFARDGCHPDDFPCHCANSQVISDLIEPCIFPWLNKTAACSLPELGKLQVFVTDSCKFYNATQYADYNLCGPSIDAQIWADIKKGTAPKPTMKAQQFKPECPIPPEGEDYMCQW